jgi:hypothetical protein
MRTLSPLSKTTRLVMFDEAIKQLRDDRWSHMPPRVADSIADFLEVFVGGEVSESHSDTESDLAFLLACTIVRELKS